MLSQLSYAPEFVVRLHLSSAATRYIIHQPYCFVNNFFQIFQKNIQALQFFYILLKKQTPELPALSDSTTAPASMLHENIFPFSRAAARVRSVRSQ